MMISIRGVLATKDDIVWIIHGFHKAIHTSMNTRDPYLDIRPDPYPMVHKLPRSIRADHDLTEHYVPDVRITAVRSIPLFRRTPTLLKRLAMY